MSKKGDSSSRPSKSKSKGSKSWPKACANPLFESWLLEWKDFAADKNSKMQFVYAKALKSIRLYPLPLNSGRECKILEFFGDALCRMIDSRLSKEGLSVTLSNTMIGSQQSVTDLLDNNDSQSSSTGPGTKASKKKKMNPSSTSAAPRKRSKKKDVNDVDDDDDGSSRKLLPVLIELDEDGDENGQESQGESREKVKERKRKGAKSYIPAYRSGPYAILLTLIKKENQPGYRGYMLKSELQQEAQLYCDASFKKPETSGSHYTAWNSMKTLLNKEYVLRQGTTPPKFALTVEGRELAMKLLMAESDKNGNHVLDNDNQDIEMLDDDNDVGPSPSHSNFSRVHLNPSQFEIVLCVDTGETNSKTKKEEVIDELRKNGVSLEVTRLSVGDFIWVCREVEKESQNTNKRRLTISRRNDMILPYIVERKRADDLAHSIRDGRFHEQKFRLEKTGLKPIYLIEAYGTGDHGLADGALNQAIANTQIINNFLIYETGSIKDTCGYLTQMTRHLANKYQKKRISSCTKEEWNTLKDSQTENYLMRFYDFNEFGTKTKNWTAGEMFAKHLLKIRGVSVDKAFSITQKYPTLQSLFRAYRECSNDRDREFLVSRIYFGNNGRTIGPAVSKILCKLYYSDKII